MWREIIGENFFKKREMWKRNRGENFVRDNGKKKDME